MPFQKGKSGNPRGRPRKNAATADKLRSAIESDLPKIIAALKKQALNGDVTAAKLLLDRVLPPLKPTAQAQPVPVGGDLLSTGENILHAMAQGTIPPEVAKSMLDSLAVQAKLIEHEDFDQRLKALEQQQHGD